MLYSPVEKIEHILKNYNIASFNYCKYFYNFSVSLINIHNGALCDVYSDLPMINLLQYNSNPTITTGISEHLHPLQNINLYREEALIYSIFKTNVLNLYKNEYYYRFNCLKFDSTTFGTEYLPFYQHSDLYKILELNGIYNSINYIYGHFILTNDNKLRICYKPITVIDNNVEIVYFSDFFTYDKIGNYFNAYYVIYKKLNDTSIYITYYNSLIDNIKISEKITINLSDIYNGSQDTFESDINDITKYNTKFFIAFNLLGFGIFTNTTDGIIRYIPIIFDKNFFNIIINKMKIDPFRGTIFVLPITNSLMCNSGANSTNNGIIGSVASNDISPLLNGLTNVITQKTYKSDNLFNFIHSITSTAEYYNQSIFDTAINIADVSIPLYIKSKDN